MNDELEFDDDDDKRADDSSFAGRVIPDMVKKAIMGSMGSSLSDMKVPKEAMGYIVSQVDKSKREVVNSLARELRSFLQELELQEIISSALEGTTFEINTTIRVLRDDEGKPHAEVLKKSTKMTRDDEGTKASKKSTRKKTTRKSKSSKKKKSKASD